MRLIDADAMKKNVVDKTDGYYEYKVKQYHAWIDAQPTVEQAQADWDLISRSGMLADLKENYVFMTVDGYTDLFNDFIEFIKRQPSVAIPSAEPKWINVNKVKPHYGQEVLLCTDAGEIVVGHMVNHFGQDEYTKGGLGAGYLPPIVAWMPLPKPWEGEHDEADN